ncbi:hypothetical protein [Coleofasciculus sp.]|uniref:hypothetical protein n=1 Tax=Coleofasciculus sp. TaxID=3100458 RepID=UPI0039FB0675
MISFGKGAGLITPDAVGNFPQNRKYYSDITPETLITPVIVQATAIDSIIRRNFVLIKAIMKSYQLFSNRSPGQSKY